VLGAMAGEDEHVLIANEMPIHSHALMSSTATAQTQIPADTVHLATASAGNLYAPAANAPPYATMAACVAPAGSNFPHNNIMPTVVGNYCICFEGVFPSPG
jgi:microcystin-dependent protein